MRTSSPVCSKASFHCTQADTGTGQAHDVQQLEHAVIVRPSLIVDRVYQGDETRQPALELAHEPVVLPFRTWVDPWEYDRGVYKRRNEIARLFRRLKGFRRIFSGFEKPGRGIPRIHRLRPHR